MSLWTVEPFQSDDGAVPYQRFINDLPDFKFAALDAAVTHVLSVRGLDLVRTEWLKALGAGLYEFRIRHSAKEIEHMFGGSESSTSVPKEPVLLRLFVHFYGQKVILLLGGYDKAKSPQQKRQQREIAQARRMLGQFKRRNPSHRKRP